MYVVSISLIFPLLDPIRDFANACFLGSLGDWHKGGQGLQGAGNSRKRLMDFVSALFCILIHLTLLLALSILSVPPLIASSLPLRIRVHADHPHTLRQRPFCSL